MVGGKTMGQFAISMPQLGESIAEATLLRLKVKPGETVVADQEVAEVETSKAVMSVTTSYGGVWKEWKAKLAAASKPDASLRLADLCLSQNS